LGAETLMTIDIVSGAGPNGIDIAYECFGDRDAPPVLLVMGLGAQMLGWPEGFCWLLVERGLQVIRYDNRDVGESTHLHDAPEPDVMAVMAGDTSSASYTLSDMAADTAGLLDALGLDSAHIVGVSLGGMIAQTLVIEHPERVRSLTSISSSTSDPTVGQATPEALQALAAPPPQTREEAMDRAVAVFRVIGSPAFPLDERDVRERAGASYDRGSDPAGVARQLIAALASPDRTPDLRSVGVPALVLHGAQDPLVDVSGARATAEALPNAELVVIDGMGHDLPRALWAEITGRIADLVDGVEHLACV
jgi:pimeloyl-ACP methyl ester carboxylesterase